MEFLDTNVLVYAASPRAADQQKTAIARDLLRRGPSEFAISLQVLQEFYVAARAPRKLALSHDAAVTLCGQWRAFTVFEPTLQLFDAALGLCGRYQIAFYDAAILAAAKQLGCKIAGGIARPFVKLGQNTATASMTALLSIEPRQQTSDQRE